MGTSIVIEKIGIRQENGLYCLNDLHRAAGNESRHKPDNWLRNQQTQELIAELDVKPSIQANQTLNSTSQIPVVEQNQQVIKIINGGDQRGTYVCRELVYAYAMWINPRFHIAVIHAFDAMQRQPAAPAIPQTLPEALRLAADLAEQNQAQQARLAIAEPKAAALDSISAAAGDLCLTDAAKTLGVKRCDLIAWLQAHRWIHKRSGQGQWIAYQPQITRGHLRHVEHTYTSKSTGEERISSQVRVTAKGLTRLAGILGKGAAA